MTSAYVDWNTAQVAHLLLKIGPKTSRWRQLHPHQHHASHGAAAVSGPILRCPDGQPRRPAGARCARAASRTAPRRRPLPVESGRGFAQAEHGRRETMIVCTSGQQRSHNTPRNTKKRPPRDLRRRSGASRAVGRVGLEPTTNGLKDGRRS